MAREGVNRHAESYKTLLTKHRWHVGAAADSYRPDEDLRTVWPMLHRKTKDLTAVVLGAGFD